MRRVADRWCDSDGDGDGDGLGFGGPFSAEVLTIRGKVEVRMGSSSMPPRLNRISGGCTTEEPYEMSEAVAERTDERSEEAGAMRGW